MIFKNIWILVFFCCFSSVGIAQSETLNEQLIVSNCMFHTIKDRVHLLSQSKQFSLVSAHLDDELLQQLNKKTIACGKFINLESYLNNHSYSKLNSEQLLATLTQNKLSPNITLNPISHDEQVQQVYKMIDSNKIWETNQHLTDYTNRSAKSNSGIRAAHWFKNQFNTLAQEYKRTDVASYFISSGTYYKQPSVLAVIGKDKPGEAIVIGAHIDTMDGNMPGADDDASGISVAFEIARVLLATDIKLNRPVYIVAYAAEERGMVGSSFVVKYFKSKKIPVKAVLQLDQAGYRANAKDSTIWLMKDYVDKKLTQYVAELMTHYVKIPVSYTKCGYACSDHASWNREGFSVAYPSATTLKNDNPYVHTSEDKLEILNLEHMVNFTKLGLAFAIELGLD